MEEQQSFDEFFRESLADYRETPPPAAWDMVARRLDEDDRRRRRGFFYWPWIALSLLLMVGAAWWLYGWNSAGPLDLAQNRDKGGRYAAAQSQAIEALREPAGHTSADVQPAPAPEALRPAAVPGSADAVPEPSGRGQAAAQGPSVAAQVAGGPATQQQANPLPQAPAQGGTRTISAGSGTQPVAAIPAAIREAGSGIQRRGAKPLASVGTVQAPATSALDQAVQGLPVPDGFAGNTASGNGAQPGMAPTSGPRATDDVQPVPAAGIRARPEGIPAGTATAPAAAGAPAVPRTAARPDLETTPTFTRNYPDPVILLASLEPALHLAGGVPLPPVLGIYECGLLDPANYQEPVPAASPVAESAGAGTDMEAAAAMYPPDSSLRSSGRIMSLSGFLGYERGIKTPPRNMFTAGLSLMWQLGKSFSVGVQPALLYGNLPRTTLTTDKAYQRSAVDVTRFVTRDYSPSILGQIDTVNNYVIREAFDSIIVRGTYLKGSLWQLELPLILQYNPFGAAFRVYGGPSVYFGGGMKIRSEGANQVYTIDRKDSIVQSAKMTEEQIKNYFGKSNLESYSNYDPNLHSFNALDPVRLGYQFGVGYQRNRMNFDLSVRQQLSGYHQLSSELKQLYALPAFRLSFGYMLIPQRPRQSQPIIH